MHNTRYRNWKCTIKRCPFCKTDLLVKIWNDFKFNYISNIQSVCVLSRERLQDIFELIEK